MIVWVYRKGTNPKRKMEGMMNVEKKAIIGEYKGNALIVLNADSKFPFQFGMAKAKLILEHLDSIRKFVESDGKAVE